jgi:transcriptional regulator CtsR
VSSISDEDFHWREEFEIIECAGCENTQFRYTYGDETMARYDDNGEDVEYYDEIKCYPLSLNGHENLKNLYGLPLKIKTIYNETLEAFKVKSYILTGVGFRAIIEAICIDKNIAGKNLQQKINNLLKEKLITEKESKRLHSIRFLGNDSVHEMLSPEPKKLFIVLGIVEHLLNNLYLIDLNIDDYLDTMITEYNDFEELIWYFSNKLKDKEEFIIKGLLGKHIRRIESDHLIQFIQKLISKIEDSSLDWLTIEIKETNKAKLLDSQKFKITK